MGVRVCSLLGGLVAENLGWRYIFFASIVVAVIGMLMVKGTPESKAETKGAYKFDLPGVDLHDQHGGPCKIVVTKATRWAGPAR